MGVRSGGLVRRSCLVLLLSWVRFLSSLAKAAEDDFLAAKPRRSWGTVVRVTGLEVLFQVGSGNKLKLELQTRTGRALLLVYRSLSILLPVRSGGGKGLGFLAC